ncbi:MAG: TonB-dependent receptor [Candidatus Cryptobacteroides sp.]|nr:TonB-dependent receptor [Candidatus Cryptobacteroides sp.]
MKKRILTLAFMGIPAVLFAQMPDTTGIYGERRDSLQATVKVATQAGNYIPRGKDFKAEVISAAGLCKMACCNLAESFENSASVTVGYSDAVTGARQIRLLGQSGIYTQMLDENRPVMRGLSAPFGLTYIPGQWLESIQIGKGVASVINGVESMTGQINVEHRKPTDEKPLYVQASIMDDGKADLNVISSIQLDEEMKWSTVILGHIDGNANAMDMNGDKFRDDPTGLQMSLANRWLYYDPSGLQVRFGVSALQDHRQGGQLSTVANPWQSDILNRSLDAYLKVGLPISDDSASSIALVADWNYQNMDSSFGLTTYDANQQSAFVNLLLQKQISESHKFTLGLSNVLDVYNENLSRAFDSYSAEPVIRKTVLNTAGVFSEYTYHAGDKFSAILGLRADWFKDNGLKVSPRMTLKWAPVEDLVLRANAGRGIRYSNPVIDNFGVLSTSKVFEGDFLKHNLEDAITAGVSATWYLPFGSGSSTYLSADYFRTDFLKQMVCDYDHTPDAITFYYGGQSVSHNFQLDFSMEPVERFTVTLTGRYTDATQQFLRGDYFVTREKPMTSKFKAVLNLQYSTNLSKWIFDFTASANGPCKVWDIMKDKYPSGYTETYPLLYAQVTRRFKGFDIYLGGENLTGYRQKDPIIGADSPFNPGFDASCVWGPLMGTRIYAGIRVTIWKTDKL